MDPRATTFPVTRGVSLPPARVTAAYAPKRSRRSALPRASRRCRLKLRALPSDYVGMTPPHSELPDVIRARAQQWGIVVSAAVCSVFILLMALGMATRPTAVQPAAAIAGVVVGGGGLAWGWFGLVRLARSGIYIDTTGLTVRNPFRSRKLSWRDIDEVRLEPLPPSQLTGYVLTRTGERIRVFGVQVRNASARRSMAELIDALNHEIVRRRQGAPPA